MYFRKLSRHNRSDSMKYIAARKIKCRCNFGFPCRLVISLLVHQLIADQTQLDTADAVNDIIHAGVARYETSPQSTIMQKNNLNLNCSIDDKEFIINADFERLTRVMENIFSNAVKYSADNSNVTFESKISDDKICIRLSNTVKEDSQIDVENMLDRFYKEDQSRADSDSSGLGLAIAKRIIELHNGEIFAFLNERIITVTVVLYLGQTFPIN